MITTWLWHEALKNGACDWNLWFKDVVQGWKGNFTPKKLMTNHKDFLVMRGNKPSELFLSCWLGFFPIVTAWDKEEFFNLAPHSSNQKHGGKKASNEELPSREIWLLLLLPTHINSHPCLVRKTALSFLSPFPASHRSHIWKKRALEVLPVFISPFCLDLETKDTEFHLELQKSCSGYNHRQGDPFCS